MHLYRYYFSDVHLVQSWFGFYRGKENISSSDAEDAVSYPSFSIKENLHPHLGKKKMMHQIMKQLTVAG